MSKHSLLKDHQIAELVNELTATANQYAGTQQLRSQIANVALRALRPIDPAILPKGDDNMVYFCLDVAYRRHEWEIIDLLEYNDAHRVMDHIAAVGINNWMIALPVVVRGNGWYRIKGVQIIEHGERQYRLADVAASLTEMTLESANPDRKV